MSYVVYQCDVCARQIELLLDGTRPDPQRCNITLKCRGKLSRVGLRSNKSHLFTPVVPGLADFIPRGTSVEGAPVDSTPIPITIFSSVDDLIAIAAPRLVTSGSAHLFQVEVSSTLTTIERQSLSVDLPQTSTITATLFEISPELLTANKYTYVIAGTVQVVSGQDDGPEGRTLRFNDGNQITVYVNGVLLDGSAYDRTVADQIIFTPVILDTNNVVEVYVYRDLTSIIDSSVQTTLTFSPLRPTVDAELALRMVDAWGDYGSVIIDGVERYLLFCTNVGALDVNKSYGVLKFEATKLDEFGLPIGTVTVDPSELILLLGREPFSFRDKEYRAIVKGDTLITGQTILTYRRSAASGVIQLTVDDTSVTQVFNSITPGIKISQITDQVSAGSATGTELAGTEELHPKYILGPS